MKKKQSEFTTIFEPPIMRRIAVFYRFMNRMTKAELRDLEFGETRMSASRVHRSRTYFVYEPYKPYTKFIPHKWGL